jgi:hypothetical protein
MFITMENVWDRSWRDEWNTRVLLPVYFPTIEAFVEGMNAVDTGTFFLLFTCLYLVYHMKKVWFFHYWGVPMFLVFARNVVLPVHITPPPWLWWQGVAKNRMFIWHHARWYSAANPHLLSLSYTLTHARTHDRSKKYASFFGTDYIACDQTIRVEARFCVNCAVLVWCAHDCN